MHISEYMCSSCLKNFDVLELTGRISHTAGCPHCGGRDLRFKFDRFESLAGKHLDPDPEDDPEDEDLEEEDADEEEELEEDDDEDEEDDLHGPAELN